MTDTSSQNLSNKTIAIMWGLGYIGAHVYIQLIEQWHTVVIFDNLSQSSLTTMADLEDITNEEVLFVEWNISNKEQLSQLFVRYPTIETIVHCAHARGLDDNQQSTFLYYETNITWTLHLLQAMLEHNIKDIVYCSSASLYDAKRIAPPFHETDAVVAHDAFTTSKYMWECLLQDLARREWINCVSLRISKAIWLHPSGILGNKHLLEPHDLISLLFAVAKKRFPHFTLYGNDYKTKDGSFAWDYVHIQDVAKAFWQAINYIDSHNLERRQKHMSWGWYQNINIWYGQWTTALTLVQWLEDISWQEIPYLVEERYEWDNTSNIVSTDKAKKLLWREHQHILQTALQDVRRYVKHL